MVNLLRNLLVDETGQDLVEFVLLIAFVTAMAAGMFVFSTVGAANVWGHANTDLSTAVQISAS
jgi:Flp pilus assembly pilin Flp